MTPVQQAIEALYQAFSDQPKPLDIEGCIHCVSRELIEGMLSTPLRQITSAQIGEYASSVLNTVGSDADYLYYLPRILELSATDIYWPTAIETNGKHIKQSTLEQWPVARKQALIAYFHAALDQLLAQSAYEDQEDLDEITLPFDIEEWSAPSFKLDAWICCIASTGLDIRPFLTQVQQYPAHCMCLYDVNSREIKAGKLGAFWDNDTPNAQIFLQWLTSNELRSIIEQHYGWPFEA
jgi:hypothetical protein